MVITEGFPETWDDETWTEHVLIQPSQSFEAIGVRDPLPIARIRLAFTKSLPATQDVQLVDSWPTQTVGNVLTIVSFETTHRAEDMDAFFEPAVLRYAKEHAIERVQCVVPVAIDRAKQYDLFTRFQLVLFGEAPSPISSTLIENGFRPTSYRFDPIGIEVGWVWENPYR